MNSLIARLDQRINPVLVKEIRQAVRGRFFRVSFLITLIVAGITALIVFAQLADNTDQSDSGVAVFGFLHSIYVFAVFMIVPLIANRSMASERDDNTYDALSISGLRPAVIIGGKWKAAILLQLLLLCAFLPFLSLGYTMFGLDVALATTMLAGSTLGGIGLSLLGIFTACLARSKALATVLQSLLGLALMGSAITYVVVSVNVVAASLFTSTDLEAFFVVAGTVTGTWLLMLALLYAYSAALITHPEENASTLVRVALTVLAVGLAGLGVVIFLYDSGSEPLTAWVMSTIAAITICDSVPVTEREGLGRRCEAGLRRRPRRASALRAPFLPGGGRGFLLYLVHLGIVLSPLILFPLNKSLSGYDELLAVALVACASLFFVGVPSAIASRRSTGLATRISTRFVILLLPAVFLLLPLLLGLILGDRDMTNGEFWLNPFMGAARVWGGRSDAPPYFITWLLLGAAGLVLNLPRVLAGLRELRAIRCAKEPDAASSV